MHKPLPILLTIMLIIAISIGIYHPAKVTNHHGIYVVTSLPFYQEAAQAVLGKYGKATALINNASIDPHDFEPTTNDANDIASANVIIENGLEYDGWLTNMINAANKQQDTINVANLMHKHNGDNEHLWYDMDTMPTLTTFLIKKFSKIDPQHQQQFQKNGQIYLQKLASLKQQEQQLANNSHHHKIAVSEPVFDYALHHMNYHIIDRHFELAIENGTDPSPQDINQLQNAIKQQKIAFFVNNPQSDDHIIDNLLALAKSNHIPILQITETMPNNQDYITWIHSEFNQLEKIQKNESK